MAQQDWFTANAPKKAPPPTGDWFAANAPKTTEAPRSTGGRVARGAGHAIADTASTLATASGIPGLFREGPIGALKDQYGVLQGMVNAQIDQYRKAKEAEGSGRTSEMIAHSIAAGFPILGPMAAHFGEEIAAGRAPEAAGEALVLAGTAALPKVAPKISPRLGKILPAAQTAEETAAVNFGRSRGVPIDAATATGNRYVKGVQATADTSPIGSFVAERSRGQQAQAMRRVAGELKDQASTTPANPVSAGERVAAALEQKIQRHHAEANAAYDKLREFEKNAEPDMVAPRGVPPADAAKFPEGRAHFYEDMPLAVDLRPSRAAMQPVYERLLKKKELTGSLMGAEGRALVALDAVMTGPDFAPLSTVDAALSDLKALARTGDMPELRTSGQGIAARAVTNLDAAVRARANRAGADVLKALEEGRAATKAKYATADARDLLVPNSGEPQATFRRLTANEDAGIAKLRELRKVAPQELPTVGRALLDDILATPMEEGGFSRGQKAFADWQRVGSDTKKLLFPKTGQTQALDSFFLLAKKLSENPNPSGTALVANSTGQTVLAFTNPATGVPVVLGSGLLSKILHSPKAVEFLTRGMRVSMDTKPGAQLMSAAMLTHAAKEAGVVIPFPKAADNDSRSNGSPRPAGRPQ